MASWLRSDYQRIRSRNPHFSRRAYARKLGLSSGQLSHYMNGKRIPSQSTVENIVMRSGMTSTKRQELLKKFLNENRKVFTNNGTPTAVASGINFEELRILSAFTLPNCLGEPQWFVEKLQIPKRKIDSIFANLQKKGLISKGKHRFYRTHKHYIQGDQGPSETTRRLHREFLHFVSRGIDHFNEEDRDLTLLNIPLDRRRLNEIRNDIRSFLKSIHSKYKDSDSANHVYGISIQCTPLTKGD